MAYKLSSKITPQFYTYLTEQLTSNIKNARRLAEEVAQLIPEAKDRQIYKMMYPFVQHKCLPQLNYITH